MIAEALKEALEKTKRRGPEIEMTPAARASHEKHRQIVDDLWPEYKAAELELKRIHNRLEEERERWALEMKRVQLELKDADGFEINDENTHVRIVYDNEPDEEPMLATSQQPEWAKELAKNEKPN